MKKIVLISAAMGGAALVAFGAIGTFASFTATETVGGQSAGAGTLDLTVGGGPLGTAPSALQLKPGQSTQMAYWVNNVGSLAGTLSADLKTTENAENGCNDAERSADNTCADWTSGGEFSQFATVEFLRPAVTTEAACSNETTGTSIAPAVKIDTAVAAPAVPVFDIPGGQGACVVVNVTLPPTAGNIVQSDSTTLSADLTLTQK